MRTSVPSADRTERSGPLDGWSTRGTFVESVGTVRQHVVGECRGHLRSGRLVVAKFAGADRVAAPVYHDFAVAHASHRCRGALVAPGDVVVGREDRDLTIELPRVVLELPLFCGT